MHLETIVKNKVFNELIYLTVLIIAFLFAYIYTFDSKLAMLEDNASYYILGKALAEGEGFTIISNLNHRPNNHYPPGYPIIISLMMLVTQSIIAIKILNGIFYLFGLWVIFKLIRRLTEKPPLALAITLLVLINSHLLWYSSIMMSEIPFVFFSIISLWSFTKINFERLSWKDPYFVIAILTLIISYYIRSLGVALLGGYFLCFLINKKWKAMLIFLLSFVAGAIPWFIRGQNLGGGSYLKQLGMINPYRPNLGPAAFTDFVDRFINNFSRYITYEIPSAIFPVKEPGYYEPASGGEWLLGFVITGLILYGIFTLPKYKWLIAGYALATFGILMIWPDMWVGVRFIVPLIPILALGFYYGVFELLIRFKSILNIKHSYSPYWMLLFLVLYIKPLNTTHDLAKMPYTPEWENYFSVAAWMKHNVDKNVVVSCGKPSLFYLYSNTYTVRFKFTEDPAEVIADLEKQQVDYVVIDQVYGNTFRYLIPAIRQYPHRFEQVYYVKNPDTFLLKFKR